MMYNFAKFWTTNDQKNNYFSKNKSSRKSSRGGCNNTRNNEPKLKFRLSAPFMSIHARNIHTPSGTDSNQKHANSKNRFASYRVRTCLFTFLFPSKLKKFGFWTTLYFPCNHSSAVSRKNLENGKWFILFGFGFMPFNCSCLIKNVCDSCRFPIPQFGCHCEAPNQLNYRLARGMHSSPLLAGNSYYVNFSNKLCL